MPRSPKYTLVVNRWLLFVLTLALLWGGVAQATAAPGEDESPAVPAQMDEAEWLLMVYSVADDNVLEEDMLFDIQEMELIGSTDDVHIVVQVDRYDGAYDGMGDFTSTKRFYITQDDDVYEFGSEELEDLGEVNMADGEALYDFILWATENFPASKRMLVLSDHGSGWPGGFGDPDPGVMGADDIFLTEFFGVDNLWLMEIDRTLEAALADSGIGQLDVIGFDACLMAHLEVFTALSPYAFYSVASQEVEPSLGWAYAGFLEQLVQNPQMDGADLTTAIVETYIDQDIRLYDPAFAGGLAPEQVAQELGYDITLSAVDLTAIGDLNLALDEFAASLTTIDQRTVATARSYARSYESVFGEDWPSPYIDLGNFAELVAQQSNDATVQAAAENLLAALQTTVIAERHGEGRKGSNGVAIYFPVPDLHAIADNLGYATVADRFAESTSWDEFLAFHAAGGVGVSFNRPQSDPGYQISQEYADLTPEEINDLLEEVAALLGEGYSADEIAELLLGEGYDEEFVAFLLENQILDAPSETPVGPVSVSKPIRVAPITLSAEVAYPGEPVEITTQVSGSDLAFLYTFIGRYLPDEDVLLIEDMDFIFSDANQEAGDVIYPVWPEEEFEVGFEWEPTVYAISDGETSVRVLFMPDTYGDSPTYTVDGIYTFADGSPDRYVSLIFRDGELTQIFSFTGDASSSAGAPWEVRPQPGDTVAVLQQGIGLTEEDEEDSDYSRIAGVLTFGDEPLFIETTPAPSGNYVVGVIAEDFNGDTYESYETIFVVNDEAVAEEGYVPFVDEDLLIALLHPEDWTAFADQGVVVLVDPDESTYVQIEQYVFEDPTDVADARALLLEDATNRLESDEFGLSDVSFGEELVDYALGAFNGQWLDFTADWDGTPVSGGVVVAAPTPEFGYLVVVLIDDEVYDEALTLVDNTLYSFDVLISGIERLSEGTPPPAPGDLIFADDFSDPESGLWQSEEVEDWGLGYYDESNEVYIYELAPESGAIYDYYADVELADSFFLQATLGYAGSWDNAYGLLFQVVDDESFYAVRISGDGYIIAEKVTDGEVETLIDWTVVEGIAIDEGEPNLLTIVSQGEIYDLYVNDRWVGSFTDGDHSGGTIGIIAENYDEEAPSTFYFDDLQLFDVE